VHARDRASDDWTLNLTRTFKDRVVTRADHKTPSRSLFPNWVDPRNRIVDALRIIQPSFAPIL
jgi:hypothetical protein